jgi:hypothetical protein
MVALSIFNELDRGLEKASFPEEFMNQTTMLACLRAVLVDEKDASRPSEITFNNKVKYSTVQRYLREAQEKLVYLTTNWPYLDLDHGRFSSSQKVEETYSCTWCNIITTRRQGRDSGP